MKHFLIDLVEFYQKYLSPDHSWWARKNHNPPYCKHYPTCSDYMKEAIEKKGVLIGVSKGTLRILRCMPWSKGGVDLVEKKSR